MIHSLVYQLMMHPWKTNNINMIFGGTVYGACQSKANSRRRVSNGAFIKSKSALEFEKVAITQLALLRKGADPITCNVGVKVTIWYRSRRSDLSPELVFDCLQKAGVIANDRQIFEYFARKEIDKNNPRVEISIYQLD